MLHVPCFVCGQTAHLNTWPKSQAEILCAKCEKESTRTTKENDLYALLAEACDEIEFHLHSKRQQQPDQIANDLVDRIRAALDKVDETV